MAGFELLFILIYSLGLMYGNDTTEAIILKNKLRIEELQK